MVFFKEASFKSGPGRILKRIKTHFWGPAQPSFILMKLSSLQGSLSLDWAVWVLHLNMPGTWWSVKPKQKGTNSVLLFRATVADLLQRCKMC